MLPLLLDIYESSECAGVIAPYIVKDQIDSLIESMQKSQKSLKEVIDSIPDMTSVRSPLRGNIAIDGVVEAEHDGNFGYQEENNEPGVLTPHKVSYDTHGNKIYEANIYIPCAHDPSVHDKLKPSMGGTFSSSFQSHSGSTNCNRSVYQTGSYPDEVAQYPTMSEINNPKDYSGICECCKPVETKLTPADKKRLNKSLFSEWLEYIQGIQIDNLISALIQANKMPLDPLLIEAFKVALKTAFNGRTLGRGVNVKKVGILTKKIHTIAAPHDRCSLEVFVEVENEHQKRMIGVQFAEVLKFCQPGVEISILSSNEFLKAQRLYPINVCFTCNIAERLSMELIFMELTLTNKNLFVQDVTIFTKGTKYVNPNQSSAIKVAQGSSTSVMFQIGEKGIQKKYAVNKIHLNSHTYTMEELLDTTIQKNTFEYSDLKVTEYSFDSGISQIFELNISNIMQNVVISIDAIEILPETEFNVKKENAKVSLISQNADETVPVYDGPLYTVDNESESVENISSISTDTDNNDVLEEESSPKSYILTCSLTVPFTHQLMQFKDKNAITVSKVTRASDKVIIGRVDTTKDVEITLQREYVSAENLVHNETVVSFLISGIKENSEYEIKIGEKSLIARYMNGNLSENVTNSDLEEIHFAVDYESKLIYGLEHNEIPPYYNKETEDIPTEEDTTTTEEQYSDEQLESSNE